MVVSLTATAKLVVIDDREGHDGIATGGHYGRWARVWASRPEAASVALVEHTETNSPGRLSYHSTRIVVEVAPSSLFRDDLRDWIAVEHKRSANPYLSGDSSREAWEPLFGTLPACHAFPEAWKQWVERNQESAIAYLCAYHDTDIRERAQYAARKASKNRICRGWLDVAAAAGIPGDAVLPGPGTWTAVRAMPIRLARRLGWRAATPPPRRDGDPGVVIASPSLLPTE